MHDALDDTICAIATPPGEGGIGVVRISGPRALDLASHVVHLRSGASLQTLRPRVMALADVCSRSMVAPIPIPSDARAHSFIDEALVVVMRRPHSFTGEDVVEVQCHGGPVILDQLCRALMSAGARLAAPGEFTKRAFLNGRLDLAQAEAVLDTIRAKTARSLAIAQAQRRGELSQEVEATRSVLVVALAHIEAALDFAEEDITFVQQDELIRLLEGATTRLRQLVRSGEEGRLWREGAAVAILGRPNVGKSSLMNALLKADRAIVTPVPGTTRDMLEEVVSLDGIPVRLLILPAFGQRMIRWRPRGFAAATLRGRRRTSLLFIRRVAAVVGKRSGFAGSSGGSQALLVINKCDLDRRLLKEELVRACPSRAGVIDISAKMQVGLDGLRAAIRSRLTPDRLEAQDSVLVTNIRHASALDRALQGVEQARCSVEAGRPGELVAMDLRIAADALGEITGVITTDEILERIFAEFCIGK